MGRIRSVRPEVLSTVEIASLPDYVHRVFFGLYSLVDDEGRAPADPSYVAGQVTWARPRELHETVDALAQLVSRELIRTYEVAGVWYLEIVGFLDDKSATYQRIEKPQPSRLPANPAAARSRTRSRNGSRNRSRTDSRPEWSGVEGNGVEGKGQLDLHPKPLQLAGRLRDLIQEHAPGAKKKTDRELAKWADEIRLLHESDGIEWEAIEAAIEWAQADARFWRGVVLSGKSLRKNYDQLLAQMNRAGTNGARGPAPPSSAAALAEDRARIAAGKDPFGHD